MAITSLDGRCVVLTRPALGGVAGRLRELGAVVEHVPLIEIGEPTDGGAALTAALHRLDGFDWLVVTSANGAQRVGHAARDVRVKLAAVGTATAAVLAELAGRPVDLVPHVQRTDGLLAEFPPGPATVLVARGNLASDDLVVGLRAIGATVTAVEAYRTRQRGLTAADLDTLRDADLVVVASGSAVDAWLAEESSPIRAALVTIGPTTADVAARRGVVVAAAAASPSDDDIVNAVMQALGTHP